MSKYDPITRVLRLFTILHLVAARQGGKRLSRDYLAQACECSPKTISRDIQLLQFAHIPIDYDRAAKTYSLPEKGWSLAAAGLTATDVLALALARGMVLGEANVFPFAEEIDVALDKLTGSLSQPLRQLLEEVTSVLRESGGLARDYSQAPIGLLIRAAAQRQTVEMLYDSYTSGKCERRLIDPYHIERRDGRYLVLQAWCHRDHKVKTFALNHIKEAHPTEARFEKHPWNDSDEGVVGGIRDKAWIKVVVRFDKVAARLAQERLWPFKASFEPSQDGSVILRGRVQGVEGILRELLSWRRLAQVLGGPELRARMIEELQAMSALYADP